MGEYETTHEHTNPKEKLERILLAYQLGRKLRINVDLMDPLSVNDPSVLENCSIEIRPHHITVHPTSLYHLSVALGYIQPTASEN